MDMDTFTDNHLINFTSEQIVEIFDLDEVSNLEDTEFERERVRLLSQYMVGNVSETFKEIKAMDKGDQARLLMTWKDVIQDQVTMEGLVVTLIEEYVRQGSA